MVLPVIIFEEFNAFHPINTPDAERILLTNTGREEKTNISFKYNYGNHSKKILNEKIQVSKLEKVLFIKEGWRVDVQVKTQEIAENKMDA